MSDHVDGPRSIGEPAADVTDLFAFTSPENPARTVLAMCVFPVGRRKCGLLERDRSRDRRSPRDRCRRRRRREISARERGNPLQLPVRGPASAMLPGHVIQRGVCRLPDGRELSLTVNDEKGRRHRTAMSACSPGCGPIRSISPGSPRHSRRFPICCSTTTCSAWSSSSIRAACSIPRRARCSARSPRPSLPGSREAASRIPSPASTGSDARADEHTAQQSRRCRGADDLRDLWNQQTPFAISKELQPLFLQRLKDSFADWDMRDGKADWTPEALAANANVFLDDFLLFDVAKPITDESHLEIEKSTIDGRPYQTGGGRTVDANVDRHPAHLARQPRSRIPPGRRDRRDQARHEGVSLFRDAEHGGADRRRIRRARGDARCRVVGDRTVQPRLAPAVARVHLTGTGIGQLRRIETLDGREIVERLEEVDNAKRSYRYTLVAGVPASHYAGSSTSRRRATAASPVGAWISWPTINPTSSSSRDRTVSSAEDRLAVVEAAVGDVPGLEAGRLEIDRGGESYTADTLQQFADEHPGSELFLIVGWDVASQLTSWDRWEVIQQLATLVVVNRPGAGRPQGLDGDGWRVAEVTVPNLEISSTDLRSRATDGRPLDYLVPEAAVRCLRSRGLYAGGR